MRKRQELPKSPLKALATSGLLSYSTRVKGRINSSQAQENQLIIAEGDYVMAHGRFTGMGKAAAWIAADVVRFEDGLLNEHWDVLQDEATRGRICERPSHVRRHIPPVKAKDNAITPRAFDALLTRPRRD
jgi:hypothetical protein